MVAEQGSGTGLANFGRPIVVVPMLVYLDVALPMIVMWQNKFLRPVVSGIKDRWDARRLKFPTISPSPPHPSYMGLFLTL